MSSRNHYSSDDDFDVHIHRGSAPRREREQVRYVASPPRPQRQFYQDPYLGAEQRTTTVVRSRSRSHDRRASPPQPAPVAGPVIINNRISRNDSSSDEDYSDYPRRSDKRKKQVVIRRERSRSYERERPKYMTRDDYEAEQVRKELEDLRLERERRGDREARERRRLDDELDRVGKSARTDAELIRAKKELDEIRAREARESERKRVEEEIEMKRLQDERDALREKKAREKEAMEAVERYKQMELKRAAKEKEEAEEDEKEYKRRLTEDLIKSGLDEKAIAAIINKKKIQDSKQMVVAGSSEERPQYTRMARRHLSIETLRSYSVEYRMDDDPEYLIVTRWVPEWERDQFWRHTRQIREKRLKVYSVEESKHKHHHHHGPELAVIRKKERRRSKSPGMMVWLAGGKP